MSVETIVLVAVGAVVGVVIVVKLLRVLPRSTRRGLWRWSQPRRLSAGRLELVGWWLVRLPPRLLAWPAGSPLAVEPFRGQETAAEGGAVASALRAAIARVGTTRHSSVDVVTGQVHARRVVDEVADALSVAPQGKWLGALLRIVHILALRGTVTLTGHLLASKLRGPGLALWLTRPSGSVIATTTLWASDFEPLTDADGSCDDARDDRLLRLATAGAVWTHFMFMRDRRGLRAPDFAETLGASDWQSYASLQIGLDSRGVAPKAVTRAHYALAVDRDPNNLVAQFNLAGLEDYREGARQRLAWVHRRVDPHDPCPGEEGAEGRPSRQRVDRRLLDKDPFHYQVLYKESALCLNDSFSSGREDRGSEDLGCRFQHLETDLTSLEQTLALFESKRPKAMAPWASRPFRQRLEGEEYLQLLRSLEGPLLVLRMALDFYLASDIERRAVAERVEDDHMVAKDLAHVQDVVELRDDLIRVGLTSAGSPCCRVLHIMEYLRNCGWIESRTRFNLACFYAQIWKTDPDSGKCRALAWRELKRSLEDGILVRWAPEDPGLKTLRDDDPQQWASMMAQYGPGDGLAAFDAIRASGAAKLRAAGIQDVTALAKATSTRAGCRRLAAQLGVGPILVERWAHLAALADALHAAAHDVNLLDQAGVADLDVLGKVAPTSLDSLLAKAANGDGTIPRETLKTWTDTARAKTRHLRRRTTPPQRR